jgi:glycerol uptake operon antiterminator
MPKAVEIMPGIVPSMIELILKKTNVPVIAGGLISKKEHVIDAIKAGATGVSTSSEKIWYS